MIIINHFYYLCPLWSWKRRFLEGSEGSEGSKGSEGKVDGPSGRGLCRRVASLRSGGDSGFAAEGCGLPLRAILIKSALRDLLSVSYDMISILVITRCAAPPYPAAPDFPPPSGDRINRSMLSCRDMAPWLSIHSAPVEVPHRTSKWGEVRRLACPLRRFPFAAPPNCGGKGTREALNKSLSNFILEFLFNARNKSTRIASYLRRLMRSIG